MVIMQHGCIFEKGMIINYGRENKRFTSKQNISSGMADHWYLCNNEIPGASFFPIYCGWLSCMAYVAAYKLFESEIKNRKGLSCGISADYSRWRPVISALASD